MIRQSAVNCNGKDDNVSRHFETERSNGIRRRLFILKSCLTHDYVTTVGDSIWMQGWKLFDHLLIEVLSRVSLSKVQANFWARQCLARRKKKQHHVLIRNRYTAAAIRNNGTTCWDIKAAKCYSVKVSGVALHSWLVFTLLNLSIISFKRT